jgi:hypothetical protein
MKQDPESSPAPRPWWRYGYVWLVIAGPAAVVLATIPTVWLALANPETLVTEDYYRRGVEINRELAAREAAGLAPALQGRNHAASPRTSR